MAPSPSRSRGRAGADVLLALVALVLALGALEVGLRLRLSSREVAELPHVGVGAEDANVLRWLDRRAAPGGGAAGDGLPYDDPDPLLGWSPTPRVRRREAVPGSAASTITTNAAGLRGSRNVPREAVEGRLRIAVFGCSQTFGARVGDDETYAAELEAGLVDVDVLNFGVHGYGTDQMLLRYERDGVPFHPDVVVVGFAYYHLARNAQSFRSFAKPRFVLRDDGALELVGVPVPAPGAFAAANVRPRTAALADRSVLFRWAWQRVLGYSEGRLYVPTSQAWALTRALLARFATEVRDHGGRFVLLNLEEMAPVLDPALAELAQAHGFVFANAGPELGRQRGRGIRLRAAGDAHWGPQGHRVLASVLRDRLCRDGIVPAAHCPRPAPPAAAR